MAGIKGMRHRASTSPAHAEAVRARLDSVKIANSLQDHVFGVNEMTATQVSAALGLLRKVVPDLAATQITGAEGGPVEIIAKWHGAK